MSILIEVVLQRMASLIENQKAFPALQNWTSQSSVARRQIWTNGIYTGAVNSNGYSRGAEIFRAMDAIIAKEKEAAAKAVAKKQK